jgi:TPR repeat protein
MPFALRFPIALVLSIVGLAAPAWADFEAGMDAYDRGDYATALHEWRPLAEQGNADAQNNLGAMYDDGHGVPQDYGQARLWYEKAAAQGYANAQSNLAVLYDDGDGVPQDFVQAHKWYSLAAANGHENAATARDGLSRMMTPAQIDKAQRLAREWKPIKK